MDPTPEVAKIPSLTAADAAPGTADSAAAALPIANTSTTTLRLITALLFD
jgi:hypothetical protein